MCLDIVGHDAQKKGLNQLMPDLSPKKPFVCGSLTRGDYCINHPLYLQAQQLIMNVTRHLDWVCVRSESYRRSIYLRFCKGGRGLLVRVSDHRSTFFGSKHEGIACYSLRLKLDLPDHSQRLRGQLDAFTRYLSGNTCCVNTYGGRLYISQAVCLLDPAFCLLDKTEGQA